MNNDLQHISLDAGVIGLLIAFIDREALDCASFRARLTELGSGQRIPIENWWSLLNELHTIAPRDDLGLKIGECVQPHHAGVLGYLGMYSESLGQALMRFHRFQPLLHNLVPTHFRVEGESVVLGWSTERRSTRLSDDVVGAGLMQFVKLLTGRDDLKPNIVKTPNTAPTNKSLYERFYGCPVEFQSAVNEFHFPARYMTLPVNTKDSYLSGLLERQAEAMMQALPKQDAFLSELQQHILAVMQDEAPEMSQVAQRMGMAERTLYRALHTRGVRYKEIVNAVRFELAKDYLTESSLTLPEISLLLGFADQSVFSRAFKQWSGETPLRWRRMHSHVG